MDKQELAALHEFCQKLSILYRTYKIDFSAALLMSKWKIGSKTAEESFSSIALPPPLLVVVSAVPKDNSRSSLDQLTMFHQPS